MREKINVKKVNVQEVTENLFVDINEREQLEMVGKDLFYKGEKLSDVQKQDLATQADTIKTLEVTEILFREMEHVACRAMYYQGENDLEALKFGKNILWTIDVLRKKIHNLSKLKQ